MDPSNSSRLYYGTNRIWRSTNAAAPSSWATVGNPGYFGGVVTAIGVAPGDPATLYAATQGTTQLRVTRNATAASPTWTNTLANGLPNRWVTDIAVNSTDAATAYVVTSGFGGGHVFKTGNAGAPWANISGNLPDTPVNAIAVDEKTAPNASLYVGTDVGVFASVDNGATWQKLNAGLPNTVVMDLLLDSTTDTLVAFTHGRSAFAIGTPPATTITSGPSGATNDPTPTFTFSSSEAGSTFQCKLDTGAYSACTSPKTTANLADGPHTFYVRATDPAGNTDPTPAARSFTVETAEVKVSGSTLVITAATGAKDNLAITGPSASVLRVTDFASGSGAYTGSGVHTGAGCTRSGDYTANCNAAGITLIQVVSRDQIDRVVNSTAVKSSLHGGSANDILTGGSANDTLTGATGADVMTGMNGNDQLLARDLTSDTKIDCDGGSAPGTADKADLDLLPKDPDSAVTNCETKTRH
jgi:hypothetical protein